MIVKFKPNKIKQQFLIRKQRQNMKGQQQNTTKQNRMFKQIDYEQRCWGILIPKLITDHIAITHVINGSWDKVTAASP